MRKLINKIVYKNRGVRIDSHLPISYLLNLILRKGWMAFWGVLCMVKKRGILFLSLSVTIKCQRKIKIGKNCIIERGCYIDALSIRGIVLGDYVSIGKQTCIECTGTLSSIGIGLRIGNNVGLGTHGFWGCAGGIEVGDDTIFGNFVSLHSENHNFSDLTIPIRKQGVNRKGIKIGNNCWIGSKVTILDGTVIGNGCVVAAGTVVRGIYPDNVIIAGVPSRIVKKR